MASCCNMLPNEELMETQRRHLIKGLQNLYAEDILSDLSLKADNEFIKAHKCVLAACSPYFRAMFSFDGDSLDKTTFKIHDVTGPLLNEIVCFLYTGQINVDDSNVQALTSAAHMLQIEPLLNFCTKYMASGLCIENCLDVYSFADFLSLDSLKKEAESRVLDNFLELYQTDQFCMLDCSTLTTFLKSDELNILKEEIVYEAVITWLKYNFEERKKDLNTLLLCVRFPLLTIGHIQNVVFEESLILENPLCSDLVHEILDSHASGNPKASCSFSSSPRLGMFQKEMLIFSGGSFSFNDRAFSCIDTNTNKCYHSIEPHPSFDLKFKLDLFKIIVTPRNEIFCIGGIFYDNYHFQDESVEASNAVLQYNQKNKVWMSQSSMPVGKCGFTACCYDGKIYVFGGYQFYPGVSPTDQTLYFDVELDEWFECDRMPYKLALQASVTFEKRAFLFGGKNDSGDFLSLVLQYLYDTNQWTLVVANIPFPVSEATAIKYGKRIFLVGGSNRSGYVSEVVSLEPSRARWCHYADFPEQRKLLSVAGAGRFIYVCGGLKHLHSRSGLSRRATTVESKDLYKYDIENNVWTKELRYVEYGNCYACNVAKLNIKHLSESRNVEL